MGLASCTLPSQSMFERSVAFASERSGQTDLYVTTLSGRSLRQLTRDPLPDQFPQCSPDGRRVAFVRGDKERAEIIVLDLIDGSERRLTDDQVRDSTPTFSRDGKRIYFTRRDGRFDRLAAIDIAGGPIEFLTPQDAHRVMPDVSADGRKLVHHSYAYGRETELALLDISRGSSSRLTEESGSDYEASFAGPDVIFSSNRGGGHYRIHRMNVKSRTAALVVDTGRDAWRARYDPRSGAILFYDGKPGNWRMLLLSPGSNQPAVVRNDGDSNLAPSWC